MEDSQHAMLMAKTAAIVHDCFYKATELGDKGCLANDQILSLTKLLVETRLRLEELSETSLSLK